VILFSQIPAENENYVNKFLVNSAGQRGAKGWAVVRYEGGDTGTGTWTCSKDTVGDCAHKRLARSHLQKLLQINPTAMDDGENNVIHEAHGTSVYSTHYDNVFILFNQYHRYAKLHAAAMTLYLTSPSILHFGHPWKVIPSSMRRHVCYK
jgi:hypothetical protein